MPWIDRAAIMPSACIGIAAAAVVWWCESLGSPGRWDLQGAAALFALVLAARTVDDYARHVRCETARRFER